MRLTFEKRQRLTGYIFVLPWFAAALVFMVYPFVFSLILSFSRLTDMDFSKLAFAGVENYKRAFVTDTEFLPKFYSAVIDMLVNTPMIVILSLLLAILVSRNLKGKGFFRAVFFLPVLLGTGYVMKTILDQNVDQNAMEVARGILLPEMVQNYLGPEVSELIVSFFGRITVIMWKSGVQIVIAMAGIQGISPALYEAARVDGATEWEMFWKITLPMITPVLLLNTVYTIVAAMIEESSVVEYIIYNAFESTPIRFEYSAAMGWIYFAFILALVLLVFLCMHPFVKRVTNN